MGSTEGWQCRNWERAFPEQPSRPGWEFLWIPGQRPPSLPNPSVEQRAHRPKLDPEVTPQNLHSSIHLNVLNAIALDYDAKVL